MYFELQKISILVIGSFILSETQVLISNSSEEDLKDLKTYQKVY